MRNICSEETLNIPKGVKLSTKARAVTVEGPLGTLTKKFNNAVSFSCVNGSTLKIQIHHGNRKDIAALRTVRSSISNLVTGVTKGYQYKMRAVYSHFPINLSFVQNKTGGTDVEVRNYLGEKQIRRVTLKPGVKIESSTTQKDEILLTGTSLENVSQSAADIQQKCRDCKKDIRKFLDGVYVSERGTAAVEV